jgi:glyoxylase-like metal-dependent hydrolase (beta-lactamase superfamily II)
MPIDLMHLGRDRVIAAHEPELGVIVDPGPASCVDTLLAGLETEPRVLLLTHIHLDHAGAAGVLVRRFPHITVYVHDIGAPHLVDPAKLLASARRLYGDDMERMWGEVAPVAARNIEVLRGDETVAGFRVAYTPGHASHHVAYLHLESGDAYVGDVAGVRIPPSEFTIMPTPPPDIDLEAWERSLDAVAGWTPNRLCLTHFGPVVDVAGQLERARTRLRELAERARAGDREGFLAAHDAELDRRVEPGIAERMRQAAPPEQLWLGLERYWRKRAATAPSGRS